MGGIGSYEAPSCRIRPASGDATDFRAEACAPRHIPARRPRAGSKNGRSNPPTRGLFAIVDDIDAELALSDNGTSGHRTKAEQGWYVVNGRGGSRPTLNGVRYLYHHLERSPVYWSITPTETGLIVGARISDLPIGR